MSQAWTVGTLSFLLKSSPVPFHCPSVSVEAKEGWASLGEFALLAMKRICIVYETTKCTSSKSYNSFYFPFLFNFILFVLSFFRLFVFVLFLQNISKNVWCPGLRNKTFLLKNRMFTTSLSCSVLYYRCMTELN